MAAPEAYCVKCRQKREMKDAHQVTMKNGRPATEGTCPVCGTKIFRIGGGASADAGAGADASAASKGASTGGAKKGADAGAAKK